MIAKRKKNPYIHDRAVHNDLAALEILPRVLDMFEVHSVVDFGSGICTWLSAAQDLGVEDCLGIDGEWVDLSMLAIPKAQFLERNLHEVIQLERKFDLAICLEVAEHLRPEKAEVLIDNIVNHSDVVLWSAAIDGQGGQNHINERPPQYWDELFRSRGYDCDDSLRSMFWQNEKVEWWYRQNILIYKKREGVRYGHDVISPPNHLIHPALFARKTEKVKRLEKELFKINSGKAGVVFYLRKLAKSVLNFFHATHLRK